MSISCVEKGNSLLYCIICLKLAGGAKQSTAVLTDTTLSYSCLLTEITLEKENKNRKATCLLQFDCLHTPIFPYITVFTIAYTHFLQLWLVFTKLYTQNHKTLLSKLF